MSPGWVGLCPGMRLRGIAHNCRMSERVIPLIDQRLQTRAAQVPAQPVPATGLLGDALGRPVGPRPVTVAERVVAQEIAALAELDRAWSEIQRWLAELFHGEGDEIAAEELLVFPGLEELVALRAVRDVETLGEYDVCVVDCAPTGSTLRMLRLPDVLRLFMTGVFDMKRRAARAIKPLADRVGAGRFVASDEVFAAFERLYADVEDVRQILLDTDRTSARLVVNPARVVVDESRRSFAYLSLYGVATDAVLDKAQCTALASMAHDGLARAILPAHTPFDGDTLFALATGGSGVAAHPALVGALAVEAVARAVVSAVTHAVGASNLPAARDLGAAL